MSLPTCQRHVGSAKRPGMKSGLVGMPGMGQRVMSDISKLRWQCRRGMKELDLLLENYLSRDFSSASPAEQGVFANLLNLPDPVLLAYVMGQQQPTTAEERRVIAHLQRTPRN